MVLRFDIYTIYSEYKLMKCCFHLSTKVGEKYDRFKKEIL